jgi:5-methylcytosine-specific restriction endonuclease McrA
MPIRPENRSRYPSDWKAISLRIREAAGWKCEWCPAENSKPHPITGSKVVLTVAHLDHTPEHCEPSNLKALCQRCHNTYDAPFRRAGIRARAPQRNLPLDAITTTAEERIERRLMQTLTSSPP